MPAGKTSYVCLACRRSYKQPFDRARTRLCPECGGQLLHAGSAFAAPARRDTAAWRTLTLLLNAGIGFHKSCCGGPGFRPRTRREIRERVLWAERAGLPAASRLTWSCAP
ncbi:hypothetical protein [Streptacidiphilus melanogenes]|uniref:hypothetical protein n=1 Tax=Streptacidiphilus melanogenes TaxID=411235 RepID=UPI0005AB5675|nr:hypothetical protein [Streptacidiphilus melanogenes]